MTGTGVTEGDDKGGVDNAGPCGDGRLANGDIGVLSVPIEKPGQRPQYNWQYALQIPAILVIFQTARALQLFASVQFPAARAPHANLQFVTGDSICLKFAVAKPQNCRI